MENIFDTMYIILAQSYTWNVGWNGDIAELYSDILIARCDWDRQQGASVSNHKATLAGNVWRMSFLHIFALRHSKHVMW